MSHNNNKKNILSLYVLLNGRNSSVHIPYLFHPSCIAHQSHACAQQRMKNADYEAVIMYVFMSSIIVQQDTKIYSLLMTANCSTCFGWYLHPSSGAHITVSTVSGINETVTATCRERGSNGHNNTRYCRYCRYSDMSS